MNDYKPDQLNNLDIRVDNEVKKQFAEAAKWSKFISIMIFVFAGMMLLVGLMASSFIMEALRKSDSMGRFSDLNSPILIAIIIVVVALVSVNYFFLYKFATKIKLAISTEDQNAMTEALGALKIFFIISTVIGALSMVNTIVDLF